MVDASRHGPHLIRGIFHQGGAHASKQAPCQVARAFERSGYLELDVAELLQMRAVRGLAAKRLHDVVHALVDKAAAVLKGELHGVGQVCAPVVERDLNGKAVAASTHGARDGTRGYGGHHMPQTFGPQELMRCRNRLVLHDVHRLVPGAVHCQPPMRRVEPRTRGRGRACCGLLGFLRFQRVPCFPHETSRHGFSSEAKYREAARAMSGCACMPRLWQTGTPCSR